MRYPVWVNGCRDGRISPADRGLAYGDGLFETMLRHSGRSILLEEHLLRLAEGAEALGISFKIAQLREELQGFLSRAPADCVIKIILTRGCSGRGYLPDPSSPPTRVLSAHPLPVQGMQREGVDAGIATVRLALQSRLAGHKHLNRLEQVLLRQELAAHAVDEALVCDMEGRVVEGVFSNVFLVREERLQTPLIDQAGIRGVMRAAIIREALRQGVPVQEGRYWPDDFLAADEVFFCNSVHGVWPVRTLAGRHYGPGAITRSWQDFWQSILDSR